jgi:predicted phage-related endonuclease
MPCFSTLIRTRPGCWRTLTGKWSALLTFIFLECKTAGEFGVRLWKEGVPEYVRCQVQHQLAVTGKAAADVCVLVCGQEIRIHRIERDDALISRLIELERQFWRYVETDTAPPADGSDSAAKALQCLYPYETGTTLDLSQDRDMSSAFADLVTVREEIAERETFQAQLKQRIQQRMGDAGRAKFETGEVTWKRSKDGITLDVTRLLKEQPQLLSTHPLVRFGSRRFLISQ